MKKKWIWITLVVTLLIVIGGIAIYKEVASNSIERKTYEFLKTKEYTNNDIDDVDVKHSFINKILGYNEWRIFVEFETEEDIIFAFTYRNDEIIIQGVKCENYQLTKEEIQDYENRFENGQLKYNKGNNQQTTLTPTEVKNVSIDIYDISTTGATIVIKDTNKEPYVYGSWYKLEKEVDEKWYDVEPLIDNYGFNEMGYEVDKNNEVKFVMNWEKLYGELSFGSYRILKKVNNQYISIDFGIATTS